MHGGITKGSPKESAAAQAGVEDIVLDSINKENIDQREESTCHSNKR